MPCERKRRSIAEELASSADKAMEGRRRESWKGGGLVDWKVSGKPPLPAGRGDVGALLVEDRQDQSFSSR